jgi:hypothetical protein
MSDQRILDLVDEAYGNDPDILGILERAFEYGLIEGEDHRKKDPHFKEYQELGIVPAVIRNSHKELIRLMNSDPKVRAVYIGWTYEDIRMQAKEEGWCQRDITDEMCERVLYSVMKHLDSSLGVTWDTISSALGYAQEDLHPKTKHIACTCDCGDDDGNCTGLCQSP